MNGSPFEVALNVLLESIRIVIAITNLVFITSPLHDRVGYTRVPRAGRRGRLRTDPIAIAPGTDCR